ncbi:FecR family protein [Rhodoferax koreense]|nr:FecR domain-containing protein [Rhodoferax koreense]
MLLASAAACFAQPVGYVKTLTGEASVQSGGKTAPARVGTPLAVGDVIRTAAASSLGVTLKDNTLMSFGPSTEFTLDAYLFAPAKGDLKLGGRIASGSMHYVSGAIAHLKPEAVEFKTPSGIIGVRGTRFVVVVE